MVASRIAAALALFAAVYHLYFAYARPLTEGEHAIIHVGIAALLVGLSQASQRSGAMRLLAVLCIVASVLASIYLFTVTEDLELRFGIGLRPAQLYAGIAIITAVIVLCWMEWGTVIASIAMVALLYFFLGDRIAGPLQSASHPSFDYAMTFLISSGGAGLYGQITPISANIIFLFMVFGGLLASTGVTRLFMELGNWIGGLLRGGTAVTCVVSSSLLGTVTGATVANVAITGTFTIPTMKRQGFNPRDAGAVEAVASCGGQVLPPVMGAGAFIMAAYLGISYIEIAAHALLPALMFYGGMLVAIYFLVGRAGGVAANDPPDFAVIRNEIIPFVTPLTVLVYFLIQGYSATMSVMISVASVIFITFLRPGSWRSRAGLANAASNIVSGLIYGAKQGASLAIVTAAISLVAQSLVTTALGPKFASSLASLIGDQHFVGLLLVMFASILLGCGLPTVAAYTMVAIMMVPALNTLGIEPLAAHMFVYYFAVYAAVTPPVATAAIVASRIAETSFWGTSWAAMRLMAGPLILPFLFIYRGEVLAFPPQPLDLLMPLIAWIIATIGMLTVTMQFLMVRTSLAENVLAAAASVLACLWIVNDKTAALAAAGALLATVMISQFRRKRRAD